MSGMTAAIWPFSWFQPFIQEPINDEDLNDKQKSSRTWTIFLLLLTSILGVTIALYESIAFHSAAAITSCTLCAIVALWVVVFRPRTGSAVLAALDIGIVVCHTLSIIRSNASIWTMTIAWNVAAAMLAFLSLVIVLNMPLRDPAFPRTGISPPFTPPTKELRSPEDDMTLWQWMSVSWMNPLVNVGCERQMHDADVWFLGYEFQHTHLHEKFRNVTGTVLWRLIKANWIDLLVLTLLALFELAAQLAGPLLLQSLLQAMEFLDVEKKPAITYAFFLFATRLYTFQSGVFTTWFGRRCYERSRGEMITMLHEKVLNRKIIGASSKQLEDDTTAQTNGHADRGQHDDQNAEDEADETTSLLNKKPDRGVRRTTPSIIGRMVNTLGACLPSRHRKDLPNAKQPASMGKILNLMRNDVYETAQRFWEFQDIIRRPLALIFSTILTWRLIGWSCLVGIAVVILGQILNVVMARVSMSWEKVRRQATDHKLQQVSQYIEAIRHMRWYGWHLSMLDSVMSARQRELKLRVVTYCLDGFIAFLNVLSGGIVPVAVFWAYTALAGNHLRIDIAFPALQLFSILQRNLQALPNLIRVLINASIAVGRIEDFMSEPDISNDTDTPYVDKLELVNASFSWPGNSKPVIHAASVSFPPGLTVIFGPVGSGKSALLQALLGELDLISGELHRREGSVGYCAQTPWLQSMTIRENILFGALYNEVWYKKVLDACALLPDLASFQHGDLSPIGENGIGLSGGQKARVALARALYSDAKYLLLDDPISALDHQTAVWIVDKCFRSDLLKDRTVILVTHRTDLCHDQAGQLVGMSNGVLQVHHHEAFTSEALRSSTEDELNSADAQKAQESAAIPEKFETEEHRAHGGVQLAIYWEYIKAGKLKWWFIVILSCALWRTFDYGQTWFLKEWSEAYKSAEVSSTLTIHTYGSEMHNWRSTPLSRFLEKLPDPSVDVMPWLKIFLVVIVIQAFLFLLSEAFMIIVTYNSGKTMFQDIMNSVSNATFHFYDTTPVGRLMNRITGDVSTVDGAISRKFLDISWYVIGWVASLLIIASATPLFLICSIILTLLFVYFFLRFLPTSQSLRRLEMVSLSPLMSNFGALLHGLMTVRAFQAQSQFQARVIEVTDSFQKMDHFYWSLQTWLTFRFDIVAAVATFLLTILAIYSGLSPGLTAFVLIAAQRFVWATHTLCKQYGQLQLDFVSVERVVELLRVEQENPGTIDPPAAWPSPTGDIVFENVTIRYAPHLPPALKNISVTIPGGSSTAIVGRTGSGKSTLALAVLATIAPEEGRIIIDGIDISKVSKQALRTRITFLAQDPILFPGTLRTNLDPLSQHTDTECAEVLDRIGGDKFSWTLKTAVDAGGKNLSQGQRQLVGLARALLRRSSIIIMDEATASIDLETSREVQKVVRHELGNSTVLGIAHRSSAVESCDFVVRLAAGEVVSKGVPETTERADQSSSADQSDF